MFDVAVIGGGFAGLSAALYAARAGAETVVLERAAPGGQILTAGHVENYPGGGVTDGAALAEQLTGQVRAQGVRILGQEVTGISAGCLETDGGQFGFRALILATGAERRRLGVPGEDRFAGRGVSWCAACDGFFFRGKTVAVVGGDGLLHDLGDDIIQCAVAAHLRVGRFGGAAQSALAP